MRKIKEKAKTKKAPLISILLLLNVIPVLCGLSGMNAASSLDAASLTALANECMGADNSKAYLEYRINDTEDGKTKIMQAFQTGWAMNFNGHTTHLVAAADQKELVRSRITFGGVEISSGASLTTVNTYANSGKRFECICFERLKTKPASEELFRPGWADMIVWLPDYMGDRIIENNQKYRSYDDIMGADYPLDIFLPDGTSKKCKITNFFHVKGFSENYATEDEYYRHSDHGFGRMFSDYIGDFILTTDTSLGNSPDKAMVAMIGAKRYDFSDYLDFVCSWSSNAVIQMKYSKIEHGIVSSIPGYENLISYHMSSNVIDWRFFEFLIGVVVLTVFYIFLLKNKIVYERFAKTWLRAGLFFNVIISAVILILRTTLFENSVLFGLLFGHFFGIALLLISVFQLACLLLPRFRKDYLEITCIKL